MIREESAQVNPYLKMRGDSQLRAKHAFARAAGWRYGLIVGVLIVIFVYGWDAAQLYAMHAELWSLKLALALVTIFPLATLSGALSGFVNWVIKLVVWILFGIVASWCVLHIPFEGVSWVVQNFDASARDVKLFPMPNYVADSLVLLTILSAGLGILVAGMQSVTGNLAWERSTQDYKMTLGGWAMFFLALPLIGGFAVLFDGTANYPLRAPLALIQNVIASGMTDASNLDESRMESHEANVYRAGQQWRKSFSAEYTIRLAASEPRVGVEPSVDVSFANGFNWRCQINGHAEFVGTCYDLNVEYVRYIQEFIPRGSFRCANCEALVTPQAAQWRGEHARPLGSGDKISVNHGAGSLVRVRVASTGENSFECLFWGANPVIVQECKNV